MQLAKPVPRVYQAANSVGTELRPGARISRKRQAGHRLMWTCMGLEMKCKGK
jgi:hypothetical protein